MQVIVNRLCKSFESIPRLVCGTLEAKVIDLWLDNADGRPAIPIKRELR